MLSRKWLQRPIIVPPFLFSQKQLFRLAQQFEIEQTGDSSCTLLGVGYPWKNLVYSAFYQRHAFPSHPNLLDIFEKNIIKTQFDQMASTGSAHLRIVICLVAVHLLIVTTQAAYSSLPALYLGTVFWNVDSITFYSSTPLHQNVAGYTMSVPFRSPLPNIQSIGISLLSFSRNTVHSILSIYSQVSAVTASQLQITVNPVNVQAQIVNLGFSIVIVSVNSYIQVVNSGDLVFQLLNTRIRTASTQTFTLTSTKFVFNSSYIQVASFLSWLITNYTLLMPISSQNYQIQAKQLVASSNVTLIIKSDKSYRNQLYKAAAFVLIYDLGAFSSGIAFYYLGLLATTSPGYQFVSDFGVPNSIFGYSFYGHNCIMGITSYLNLLSMHLELTFVFTGSSISSLSFGTPSNASCSYLEQVYCFAVCPSTSYILNMTHGYNCVYCSSLIPNCLNCQNAITAILCTACMPGYSLSTQNACLLCSTLILYCHICLDNTCIVCLIGWVVNGICMRVAGCTALSPFSGQCQSCDTDMFQFDNQNNTCICKAGHLAGRYCIDVVGCTSSQKVGSTIQCLWCNNSLNFLYDAGNKTCYCKSGFFLQDNYCQDYCGDGRVFTNECDDGNLINGDGCSSVCTTQPYFRCFDGSADQASLCKYIGNNIAINLVDTQKSQNANQAIFTFAVDPDIPQLSQMDLSKYFSFACDCSNYSVNHWSYNNGKVELYLDYGCDLESASAKINFSFDSSYIIHTPINCNFSVASNGYLLLAYQQHSKKMIIGYLYLTFAFLSILMMVIGSCIREMAGVQFIQILQMIYYLHFSIKNYTQTLSSIQYLSTVALNNLFMQSEHQNYLGFKDYQKVGFSPEYAETALIGLSSFYALGIIIPVLIVCYQTIRKQTLPKTKTIYSNTSFLLTLALFLPTQFIFSTYLTRNNLAAVYVVSTARSLLILESICIVSLLIFKQRNSINQPNIPKDSQRDEINLQAKSSYFWIYLGYQILNMVALNILILKGSKICLYVMIAATAIMILWQFLAKPYQLFLSNLSIFLNQALLLAFQIYLLLKDRLIIKTSEQNDIITHFILISFILVCLVITIFRVCMSICVSSKRNCQNSSDLKLETRIKVDEKKLLKRRTNIKENMLEKQVRDRSIIALKSFQKARPPKNDEQLISLVAKMKRQFYQKKWNRTIEESFTKIGTDKQSA